jgi:hypothetical protein
MTYMRSADPTSKSREPLATDGISRWGNAPSFLTHSTAKGSCSPSEIPASEWNDIRIKLDVWSRFRLEGIIKSVLSGGCCILVFSWWLTTSTVDCSLWRCVNDGAFRHVLPTADGPVDVSQQI